MLPQFGLSEFLLIAVVALIVVGPKDLPLMMRRFGQFVGKARAMAKEFQSAFDDIAKQAELDELRKEIEDLKKNNPLKEAEDEFRNFEREVNAEVMKVEGELKPEASEKTDPAAVTEEEAEKKAEAPVASKGGDAA